MRWIDANAVVILSHSNMRVVAYFQHILATEGDRRLAQLPGGEHTMA